MAVRFTELILDARDAVALGAFWSAVLGWPVSDPDDEGDVELTDPDGRATTLLFTTVPDHKEVKNRLHLDISPVGCDQEEELDRLLQLGARPVDIGQGDQTWVVLADPEGNEFCLLRQRVD